MPSSAHLPPLALPTTPSSSTWPSSCELLDVWIASSCWEIFVQINTTKVDPHWSSLFSPYTPLQLHTHLVVLTQTSCIYSGLLVLTQCVHSRRILILTQTCLYSLRLVEHNESWFVLTGPHSFTLHQETTRKYKDVFKTSFRCHKTS
jgi:hypothetical protein